MSGLNTEQIPDDPEYILATSGESFHWARRFLGKKMGQDAAVLYAFCRVLDDMADGDIPDGPKHLENIQASLGEGRWDQHPLLAPPPPHSAHVPVASVEQILRKP